MVAFLLALLFGFVFDSDSALAIQIFVRVNVSGQTITIEVEPSDTIVFTQFQTGYQCTQANVFVTKYHGLPGLTSEIGEMPIYWHINSDCSGEYRMILKLCYTISELAQSKNVTEDNLVMFKNIGGATWTNQGGVVNTSENCVTLSNVLALGYWTLGDPTEGGPTVISLLSLSARNDTQSSRILLFLEGVLAGAAWWIFHKRS